MDRTRDDAREAAEAEIHRVGQVLSNLEDDLAYAVEHAEHIENEPFDSQAQAAAIERKMESAQRDIERLQQKISEAEDDLGRAYLTWGRYSGDVDVSEGDANETLDVTQAADIWRSNGMDEDYRFGYSEDELRRATE